MRGDDIPSLHSFLLGHNKIIDGRYSPHIYPSQQEIEYCIKGGYAPIRDTFYPLANKVRTHALIPPEDQFEERLRSLISGYYNHID